VKKKKSLKIVYILACWLIGEVFHHWLSFGGIVVKNYGISFGINGWFWIVLNIFFVAFLTIIWFKNTLLSIGLVVAGGWINLIDRIIFGYVRDYWQLGWFYNNLADWLIQAGIIIYLLRVWIKKSK